MSGDDTVASLRAGGPFPVAIDPGAGCGPVRLGMSAAEVVSVLGEPEGRQPERDGSGETLFWHQSSFQVRCGPERTAVDIMLCRGPAVAVLQGIDVLTTPADEVLAALKGLGEGRYEEDGYSFVYPEARLAFWRQGLPDEAWEPEDHDQYREGRFWDTVSTWSEDARG